MNEHQRNIVLQENWKASFQAKLSEEKPFLCGASSRIRTYDLLITSELHYHCAIEAFGSLMGIEPTTTRATTWHSTNWAINSRWIRTTTSRTEIWHATNYTMELLILLVAPEGIEPSLTGPKPVVLPLYHRANWVREVGLEPTKSSDSGFFRKLKELQSTLVAIGALPIF